MTNHPRGISKGHLPRSLLISVTLPIDHDKHREPYPISMEKHCYLIGVYPVQDIHQILGSIG